ncbi:ankyrin repeat-containing protein At5g02620-like isoform X2 [Papaver somniferum]|uniref:ankyrin repeat-containing protein At5g02620-like isoform X2 n=1 Tax=Papaver somniferum TaxID=3469 RepID=UPI000E6FD9E9|nr:ankyrin repeat-containing protein At5g02620-like isoform X2 [Papaver somniferum]
MEKIYLAARKGDVKSLAIILDANPNLRLHDATFTSFRRTPLHVAAMLGHVKFAEEILRLTLNDEQHPADVKDSQGFTALHLASVRGNVDMVRLLLNARVDTCTVPDQDGRTPLHLAAMRNNVEVMEMLLLRKPDAIYQVLMDRRETILHLCVKHHTFKALKSLVEYLSHSPSDTTTNPNATSVNSKDIDGNTILHLAAKTKQLKVMDYLLEHDYIGVEINALNKANLRALQMLAQNEMDDIQMLAKSEMVELEISCLGYFCERVDRKTSSDNQWMHERVNMLMVVAVLIAGIAFQATVSPPGGVFQEDSETTATSNFTTGKNNSAHFVKALSDITLNDDSYSYTSPTAPGIVLDEDKWRKIFSDYNRSIGGDASFSPYLIRYAGTPILAYTNPVSYQVYLSSNALALLLSLSIILLVTTMLILDQPVPHVRFLASLMAISIGCIIIGYMSLYKTMTPPFFRNNVRYTPFGLYAEAWFIGLFGIFTYTELFNKSRKSFTIRTRRSTSHTLQYVTSMWIFILITLIFRWVD